MNLFRPQRPYVFRPPKYHPVTGLLLTALAGTFVRRRFNVVRFTARGAERVADLVKHRQAVLVAPNHADHADPGLLIALGRRAGITFHFMAAREGFEGNRATAWCLQRAGAFSVDREGTDVAALKTALGIIQACRYPLVIFPEGEIYHHQEQLDALNDGVATILLRATDRLPEGTRSYLVPTAIRFSHCDDSIAQTFAPRLARLEQRITWKPRPELGAVERIYRLGAGLIALKEVEFLGAAQEGDLVQRIGNLQHRLVEMVEADHAISGATGSITDRVKSMRSRFRKELTTGEPPEPRRLEQLYDDLDRLFAAIQLYSYPGVYLRENPTTERIAETIFKIEEDVLGVQHYPCEREAEVIFDEPIDVRAFLDERSLTVKSGVAPLTALLRERLERAMGC